MKNIFDIPQQPSDNELFEVLKQGKMIKIEKIVSYGHVSKENEWYDQPKDEWVLLLQGKAKILFENDFIKPLIAGEFLFIPKHQKHRVIETSTSPPCIWLAVHGNF